MELSRGLLSERATGPPMDAIRGLLCDTASGPARGLLGVSEPVESMPKEPVSVPMEGTATDPARWPGAGRPRELDNVLEGARWPGRWLGSGPLRRPEMGLLCIAGVGPGSRVPRGLIPGCGLPSMSARGVRGVIPISSSVGPLAVAVAVGRKTSEGQREKAPGEPGQEHQSRPSRPSRPSLSLACLTSRSPGAVGPGVGHNKCTRLSHPQSSGCAPGCPAVGSVVPEPDMRL